MIRRATFLVLALTALFVLQFADCFAPMSADEQTMECCGSMPCNPTNQSHDCCKTMVSSHPASVLPVAQVTLEPVTIVAADILPVPRVLTISDASAADFAAPQHSPPELYTLNSSFLI